jgi:hypothetical protein
VAVDGPGDQKLLINLEQVVLAQEEKNGSVAVMLANGQQRQLTGEAAKKFVQAFEFLNYSV